MNTLIYAVLPIFFIVGIGYLARKKDIFKDRWVDALIGYVYYIALPSLIVTSILSITITSNEVVQTLLWVTAFVVGNAILCGAFMKLVNVRKQYQAAFFLAATVGNSVYLGVPLTTTVLHTSSNTHDYSLLVLIGIYQLIASIFIALVANEFIFTSKRNMNNIVRQLAKNPLIIAIGAGLVVAIISPPAALLEPFTKPLAMLGSSASPVALFVLGAYLVGHKIRYHSHELFAAIGWRLLVLPFITWWVVGFIHQRELISNAFILYAGMPTAVTALIIARAYKFNTGFVAAVILMGTVLGLITEAAIIVMRGL